MFLKSLTLKGFKSFADASTLQLEPGVTVVVGPNGSGKSNVVDAVAWVLGAQGPRTVRSSKMEDVIYAGSADRPALGRAEVSLTIDNRAGHLPGGLAEITITRTLFRSGDSEYAINGQPCRLLDIQELLSDSGVGRQQHVIVSQGQLDAILNARPEDRRAVIEEAAGVLKHRRRRERSERRLAATEENLDRLGDLLREVRRQMRPLERQASAARSHASLAEELRALRLYLVGRELASFEARRSTGSTQRDRLRVEESELRAAIVELDSAADEAAAELSARREDDLVVALTRVQGLVERCRGLGGVLVERRRSLGLALDAAADIDVVSSLESDAARLNAELEEATAAQDALAPVSADVAQAERELAGDLSTHETMFSDLAGLRGAEEAFAVARGQLEPLGAALERDRSGLQRLDELLATVERRRTTLDDEGTGLADELAALAADGPTLQQHRDDTGRRAGDAVGALRAAEAARRDADGRRHRLEARAEALSRAAEEARGTTGAEALAGMAGVVGALGDLVEVDDGWQSAFEAAVGGALAAIVVEGDTAARAALARLADGDVVGTVLTLDSGRPGTSAPPLTDLPDGTEAVRRHVRSPVAGVAAVLDRLLNDAVAVQGGWRSAIDLVLQRPDLVVVTEDGDRFGSSGWTLHAGAAPAAEAAAEAARIEAAEAVTQADQAATDAEAARSALDEARAQALEAERAVERAAGRRLALDNALRRLQGEREVLHQEWSEAVRHRTGVSERLQRDTAHLSELELQLPELEAAARAAGGRLSEADSARRRLEERRVEVTTRRRDFEVQAAGLAERQALLATRLGDVERRLEGHAAERAHAGERRRRLEADATAVDRLHDVLDGHAVRLGSLLERLQELRARQIADLRAGGQRLESLRVQRADTDTRLAANRDTLQRLELELAEAAVRHESAVEALRRELGCEPAVALASPCPQLPEGVEAGARASAVEQELNSLGPVNPLALEELGTLEERHRFLEEQVEDVRRARRELHQVIRAVDDEIIRLFAEAFADVNEHFQVLVGALFPGGTGRLEMTEPTDLLNTGVEVEARPAGKNVRKLSLLSGGERSLVALAFLFAVFRSRPSPFYLMDEVEAALDDVNLHRFLGLLHEFRDEAQLVIVSHQKRTMEAADALYGVTMTPDGSSKVVSQKVRRQSDDQAAAPAEL